MSHTREAIITRAIDLFNERGLENVGMRELARVVGLSPGNLTYHFARKQDVVGAMMERLTERNMATLGGRGPDSLAALLETYRTVFRTQVEFRCLQLALVHTRNAYPALRARYQRTVAIPRARLDAIFRRLRDLGYLRIDTTAGELAHVVDYCTLISRFWLSDHRLDDPEGPAHDAIERYVGLLAGVVVPYATGRGLQELAVATTARATTHRFAT